MNSTDSQLLLALSSGHRESCWRMSEFSLTPRTASWLQPWNKGEG